MRKRLLLLIDNDMLLDFEMENQLDYLRLEHTEDITEYLTPTTMKQEYEDEEED